MSITVRLIFLLLLFTLAFGVWGITLLLDESARKRALWAEATGGAVSAAERMKRIEGRLTVKGPFAVFARKLVSAGLSWSPLGAFSTLVAVMVLIIIAGQVILGRVSSIIIAAMVPLAFFQWISRRSVQRKEGFISQLPELARIIANGNAAGLSIGRCLAMAGREMPEPAGQEMRRVSRELDLGWSVDQVLTALSERLPSREVNVLVHTIVIQSRTGGALSDALADISQTLEDRKELRREVSTVILGSAVAGYAVIGIGLGAVVLLNFLQPGTLDYMAGSWAGRILLVISATLFVMGTFLMRIVYRIEV